MYKKQFKLPNAPPFIALYGGKVVRMMDIYIIENYIENVYGYAVNNTFNREEAEIDFYKA